MIEWYEWIIIAVTCIAFTVATFRIHYDHKNRGGNL